MSCPRCGSTDIAISGTESLTFKCKKCGYTWSVEQKTYTIVNTPSGPVHWTVYTYYKELALQEAIDMFLNNKNTDEILETLRKNYSKYLSEEDLRKIVEKARKISQYL